MTEQEFKLLVLNNQLTLMKYIRYAFTTHVLSSGEGPSMRAQALEQQISKTERTINSLEKT